MQVDWRTGTIQVRGEFPNPGSIPAENPTPLGQSIANKHIAYDLGIHERTVKLHRTAITTKLKGPVRGGTHEANTGGGHLPISGDLPQRAVVGII